MHRGHFTPFLNIFWPLSMSFMIFFGEYGGKLTLCPQLFGCCSKYVWQRTAYKFPWTHCLLIPFNMLHYPYGHITGDKISLLASKVTKNLTLLITFHFNQYWHSVLFFGISWSLKITKFAKLIFPWSYHEHLNSVLWLSYYSIIKHQVSILIICGVSFCAFSKLSYCTLWKFSS